MGRLPANFAGRTITFRIPYTMPGELIVAPEQSGVQFPEATFLHNVDKPFEIHRIVIRLTGLTTGTFPNPPGPASSATIMEVQPDTLSRRVRLRINDFSKNEILTKSPTLVSQLLALNTGFWDFEDPYTLVRSEGFQVAVDTLDFPVICVPDTTDSQNPCVLTESRMDYVRVEIAFQGFLLVIAPPSETR